VHREPLSSLEGLGATIEARVAALLSEADGAALARTFVETPGTTVRPKELVSPSERGLLAVDALRALGASLHGKIELHHTLGEGGMGVVHLATQGTVGRHVAVKTLREGVTTREATLRILREAWVTGSLEHPNVVPIYDVGVDASGSPVIVMKRIEGQHWGELLVAPEEITRRFHAADPLAFHLDILESVCNAVHFAHSRGILHRDLKPENVMIGAFGEVYVLDWGIAVSLEEDPTGRLPLASAAKDVAGTPHYMAPEMLLGDPTKLSVRTDVYLLGAILYEIFTGTPPHEGADLNALVRHILVSPIHYPASLPDEVQGICAKAMSRDPDDRYPSAIDFRKAVDEYIRHRGSRRLATEAKTSHILLSEALDRDADDARPHDVARLLGECRFGYRAALTAWPENSEAREGLDRALLAVVEYALADGDAGTAETLLREVHDKPADVVAKVAAALRARVDSDERLHRMEKDVDASIGTRTRATFIGILGAIWTASPLAAWYFAVTSGHEESFLFPVLAPLAFLTVAGAFFYWARESMMKTAFNRRLSATVAVYLIGQFVLSVGARFAGMTPHQIHLVCIFAWALTLGVLAVWVERWFALVALICALSFLLVACVPSLVFAMMSFDQLFLTLTAVRLWLPREDVVRFHQRGRQLFHEHRRR